jgi:hypothetical protein
MPKFFNFSRNLYIVEFKSKTYNSKGDDNMLVVKAKIKSVIPGYNVSGDLADALNAKVEELVKAAATRAEGNGRKTVMAKDL